MTTKSEILNVATHLFGLHGFKEVTTRQISEAAKCNIASVFYHFENKETLYQECLTNLDFDVQNYFEKILLSPSKKEDFDENFDSFEKAFNQLVRDNLASLKLLLHSIDLGFRQFFEEKFLKPISLQLDAFLTVAQKNNLISPQLDTKTASRTIVTFFLCQTILKLTENQEFHGDERMNCDLMKSGILNY